MRSSLKAGVRRSSPSRSVPVRRARLHFARPAARRLLLERLEDRLLLAGQSDWTWRNIGPGGGGWIESIAASAYDANEVFAGSDMGGFYQAQDAGGSYTIQNQGLQDLWVERIVEHPQDSNILYLGTQGGVYRSNDHGNNWQLVRSGFPPIQSYTFSAQIGALVIDPTAPDTLYAGIGNPRRQNGGQGAVYKTTDGAANWTKINAAGTLPSDAYVNDLVIDPANHLHLFLTCQYGVYQSTDGGINWQQTITGLPQPNARRIAISASQPQVMYVTISSPPSQSPWQGGVYRSDDGGVNWSARLNGLDMRVGNPGDAAQMTANYDYLVVHPANPDIAYVASPSWVSAGIWRTTNGGASWTRVTIPGTPSFEGGWIDFVGPSATCLSMSPLDPSRLYFGSSMSIWRSDDGGDTWRNAYSHTNADGTASGTGLETTAVRNISVHPTDPGRLLVGYNDIGLLISADGGSSFRRRVTGIPSPNNNSFFWALFDPTNPEHLWGTFGQWSSNQGVLAQSTDGGQTWTTITTDLPNARCRELIFDPSSSGRVLARLDLGGVYACDDIFNSPGTWYACNTGLPYLDIRALVASPSQPGIFWSALGSTSQMGGVFYSTDGGRNWQQVGAGLQVTDIKSLVVAPSNPNRLYLATRDSYTMSHTYYGGVFRSDDGGQTWQRVLTDKYPQPLAVDPQDANIVYAGLKDDPYHDLCAGRGITSSLDGGATWQSINGTGLTCLDVTQIRIDPHNRNRLYLGTAGNGVFVRDLPSLDADGNGTADALSDGILILRYLFDPAGAWNVDDALGAGATRTTRGDIKTYLDQFTPTLSPAPPATAADLKATIAPAVLTTGSRTETWGGTSGWRGTGVPPVSLADDRRALDLRALDLVLAWASAEPWRTTSTCCGPPAEHVVDVAGAGQLDLFSAGSGGVDHGEVLVGVERVVAGAPDVGARVAVR